MTTQRSSPVRPSLSHQPLDDLRPGADLLDLGFVGAGEMDPETRFRGDLPDERRRADLARSGDDLDVPTRLPDARETRLEGDSTKGRQTDSARLRRLAPHGEQNYSPCRACQATAEVAAARTVVLAMSRHAAT